MSRASATSLPASRISAISRDDFSSGGFWNSDRNTYSGSRSRRMLAGADDLAIDVLDVARPFDLMKQARPAVVADQLLGVAVIDQQPLPNRRLLIVRAMNESGATGVAH